MLFLRSHSLTLGSVICLACKDRHRKSVFYDLFNAWQYGFTHSIFAELLVLGVFAEMYMSSWIPLFDLFQVTNWKSGAQVETGKKLVMHQYWERQLRFQILKREKSMNTVWPL